MGLLELFLLAIGLSMDAFAVSVCKGLAMQKVNFRSAAICGVWFGGFQALMPFIGYLLGAGFEKYINAVASWIAFVLLALYVLGYFFLYRKGKLEGETSEVIYKFLPKEKKKE